MSVLFKDISILSMTKKHGFIQKGSVLVEDGKIVFVGEKLPEGVSAKRIISGEGKLLLPGLVNAHTHLPMAALRGYADDYPLQTWLFEHVFPVEDRLNEECVEICAKIGIAEAIASGTTSVSDMYFFCNGIARAVAETGIRANLSRAVTWDQSAPFTKENVRFAEAISLYETWHNAACGRIRVDAAVHAEYTSAFDAWKAVAEFAAEKGIGLQFHLSETRSEHDACVAKYGKTPAQVLDEAGLLTERSLAAHCVFLTDEDISLLAERKVSIAHNPVSNLKLASGVAPVPKFLQAGIHVALGTDSVASNNNLDLFEEIKLAAILHKGVHEDAALVNAETALTMATVNGARAQGRQGETGVILEGACADVIVLSLDCPGMVPCHNALSATVYAANGSDVCLTMVDGQILYENGAFTTIDWPKLKRQFEKIVKPQLFG